MNLTKSPGFKSGVRGVSIDDTTVIQDRQEDGLSNLLPMERRMSSSVSVQISFFFFLC